MDFDRIPTRHANISDIMKTRSPNYIPVIRHYANLRNPLALTAEYNFLRNVEPDPYTHVNNYYAKTFDRHLKQFKENPNSVLENYELEYLDLLSEKMMLSRNEAENIRLKYVTGRFYGKFLDFTTFRKAKMMELVDMLGLGSSS